MKIHAKWKLGVLLLGLGLLGKGTAHAVDASITVTPNPSLNLTIAPTTYAFGSVDVAISTVSISSLTITNAGQVPLTISKSISNQSAPAGWTAAGTGDPTAALNRYVLYVATSTFHPGAAMFDNTTHLFNGEGNANALRGIGNGTPALAVAERTDVWFRLTMPSSVSTNAARTITVSFTGVSQ